MYSHSSDTPKKELPMRQRLLIWKGIFSVFLVHSLSPPQVEMLLIWIAFLKFQFQMGKEDRSEVAFCPSHDLVPALEPPQ